MEQRVFISHPEELDFCSVFRRTSENNREMSHHPELALLLVSVGVGTQLKLAWKSSKFVLTTLTETPKGGVLIKLP